MSLGVGGIVSVGGSSVAGGGSGSGIQVINPGNNTGPTVEFQGVNGITVTSPSPNVVLIDGAGASGVSSASGVNKFAAAFTSITSGIFTHSLGTEDVIVQVYDNQVPRRQMLPDEIRVENSNQVSVLFNTPQTGRVVIV